MCFKVPLQSDRRIEFKIQRLQISALCVLLRLGGLSGPRPDFRKLAFQMQLFREAPHTPRGDIGLLEKILEVPPLLLGKKKIVIDLFGAGRDLRLESLVAALRSLV